MKLPKSLLIRGCKYELKYVPEDFDYNGMETSGLIVFEDKHIKVSMSHTDDSIRDTVLHEMFHGSWHESSIYEEQVPEWIEHIIICAIAKDIINNKQKIIDLLSD